jgi:hypothetical protein
MSSERDQRRQAANEGGRLILKWHFGSADLNQLRYDLRKRKGHCLLERDGLRYPYRLTSKGNPDALLFVFFHKRLCGSTTAPTRSIGPESKLAVAYHNVIGPSSISSLLLDAAPLNPQLIVFKILDFHLMGALSQ